MSIVACPRCRDEVRVPAGASRQALVRCPLCEEEYLLSEALASLPPELVVIGGDLEPEASPAAHGGAAAAEDYRLAGGSFGGMMDSSPGAGSVAVSQPSVRGKARPKRKEKSAVGEILKVVVGGAVGLSLGLIVLWWVAGKDPLELGPQVSPYAPWIVPAKFRAKPASSSGQTAAVPGNAAESAAAPPNTTSPDGTFRPHPNLTASQQKAGGRVVDSSRGKGSGGSASSGALGGDSTGGLQTLDPLATEPTAENPLAPASLELPTIEESPTTPEAHPGQPSAAASATENDPPASKTGTPPRIELSEPTDFRNLLPDRSTPAETAPPASKPDAAPNPGPPAAQAVELQRALGAASEALTKVDEGKSAPVETRRQLFTDLYASLAEVGRVATEVDLAGADAAEAVAVMDHLADQLAAQAGPGTKMSAIGTLARTQFTQKKDGEGIALAGAVTDFRAAGRAFECVVDLGSGVSATIISRSNPQDFCQVGDQVLILGKVVENPAAQMDGYQGEASPAVLLGRAATSPKSSPE